MQKYTYIYIYIYWIHSDAIIKTREGFFINICTSHFIVRVRKGLLKVCNILTPTLSAVNVVSFSFSRAAQPEAQRPTLLGDLLHLISNFSAPQLNRGTRAPSAWCSFPYHTSSITPSDLQLQLRRGLGAPSAWCGFTYHTSRTSVSNSTAAHQGPQGPLRLDVDLPTTPRLSPPPTLLQLTWLLSWLSYIILQRPLSRLLDLWNHIFDRHQAEITVMQFIGHSLPVHQSMSVPWEFFLPRPNSSANFRPRDFLS